MIRQVNCRLVAKNQHWMVVEVGNAADGFTACRNGKIDAFHQRVIRGIEHLDFPRSDDRGAGKCDFQRCVWTNIFCIRRGK